VVPSPALQELNDDIVRQHPDATWAGSPTNAAGATELPSGTVTFLFTEVEDSTRLWEESRDVMQNAMQRHDELLRDAVESNGGFIVKSTGDGFHAVFPTAHDAVTAAVAAQTSLLADEWNIAETVRVRMGIHTGEAEPSDGDYSGSVVNRADRLMSVAHGGQIIVSNATEELLHDVAPEKYGFVDLGQHRLRDLGRPERLFQVTHPDLGHEFAPLRTLEALPGNLPLQASSFVGRTAELVQVADALGASRVVTLTGVGGVGKTRLALQVAGAVLPRFREGAWLCELAAVRDPDEVVGAVARVFRVGERPGLSVEECLVSYLRDKELLLVLDNCEHLLGAVAGLVVAIGTTCSDVRVLATSREGLNIAGEQLLVVPPLGLPDEVAGVERAGECDAVRLFTDRARQVKSDFVVDAGNRADVVAVCTRLDGVALAIELAAARIPAMSPAELDRRLDQRFRLLRSGDRVAPARHQTLRAAIDWSYDLLTQPEQRLLDRLSVFTGGCTLGAADAVCTGGVIDGDEVFELLAGLVARSLVLADAGPETRYRQLETIREYGEQHLAENGEADALRLSHAEYFLRFLGDVHAHLYGPGQVEWGARLARERPNLLAAMAYALDTQNLDLAFGLFCGLPAEAMQINDVLVFDPEPLLALPGAGEHPGSAVALMTSAGNAGARDDRQLAAALCDQALAAGQRLGSDPFVLELMATTIRADIAGAAGRLDETVEHLVDGARLSVEYGVPQMAAVFLGTAAQIAVFRDKAGAQRYASEGLALARPTGMTSAIVHNLLGLAPAVADDDPEQGRTLIAEAVHIVTTLDDENPTDLRMVCVTAAQLGDWPSTLRVARRLLLRLIRWGTIRVTQLPLLLIARGIAEHAPEAAAVLLGAPMAPEGAGPRPGDGDSTLPLSGAYMQDFLAFLSNLWVDTTQLLTSALGDARVEELRAEGAAMDKIQACMYALANINEYLDTLDSHPR
jgi:predicted ATPase/class 3 adenylate cyclase